MLTETNGNSAGSTLHVQLGWKSECKTTKILYAKVTIYVYKEIIYYRVFKKYLPFNVLFNSKRFNLIRKLKSWSSLFKMYFLKIILYKWQLLNTKHSNPRHDLLYRSWTHHLFFSCRSRILEHLQLLLCTIEGLEAKVT